MTYLLEIDDDPAFASVDYQVSVVGTNHQVSGFLDAVTTYYWRVTPENQCVTGSPSSVFSFTTANISCAVYNSTDVPLAIPQDGGTSGTTTSFVDVSDSGQVIAVTVTLAGTHTLHGRPGLHFDQPRGNARDDHRTGVRYR